MAPPSNRLGVINIAPPSGCIRVCFGHKDLPIPGTDGSNGDFYTTILSIYVKQDTDDATKLVFCAELKQPLEEGAPIEEFQGSHEWSTEEDYLGEHATYWHQFDMEPNPRYDIGNGLRGSNGEHMDGSSKICERDGTLKMDFIREACRGVATSRATSSGLETVFERTLPGGLVVQGFIRR